MIPRRISGLFKAEYDIVAELFGSFVLHIFDENAEFFGFPGAHLFGCVAHFNGGVQYGLPKLFADVAGAVQSFGNSADGNAETVCNIFYRCHRFSST